MPSRGRICGPVATMGTGWPNNHWFQRPTICRDTFNRGHHAALDTCSSVILWVVFTYEDLCRGKHGQHDLRLVHIVNILCQYIWIPYHLSDYFKPVRHLIIDIVLVASPVHSPDFSWFERWMAFVKALSPVLAWRLHHAVRRGALAGDTEG